MASKKALTKSVQYLPKLLINNNIIPTIKTGKSFRYLGSYFDFDMSNDQHKSEITSIIDELMSDIDHKPLHPKNKLLVYSRHVLSKISWHLTVASLSKTWVIENIDSTVNSYIRKWLEVPVSGTLSNVYLSRNKFGQNIIPPPIKFTQCQTVHRNALKSSPNDNIKEFWTSTSNHTNVQYDSYKSTKEVLKSFHLTQEDKLNRLTCQGSFLSNVSKFSLLPLTPFGLHLNQNYQKTFSISRFVTLITPFPRERIFANGVSDQAQTARFVFVLNHFYTLSRAVNITLSDLHGDTIPSSTFWLKIFNQ